MTSLHIPIQTKRRINMEPSSYSSLIKEAIRVDNSVRTLFNNVIKELYRNTHYSYEDLMDEYTSITELINVMSYFENTIHIDNANDIIMLNKNVKFMYRMYDTWTWTELMIELSKFSKKYLDIIIPYTGINLEIKNVPHATLDDDELYDLINDETDIVFAFFGSTNKIYVQCLYDDEAKRISDLLNRNVLGKNYFKSKFIQSGIQNRICIEGNEEGTTDNELYFNIAFGAIVDVSHIKQNCLRNRSINNEMNTEDESETLILRKCGV